MTLPPETYFRAARSLVGRAGELALVTGVIDDPAGAGAVVFFEGQGGIGKTRLLAETRELCEEREGVLCTGVIDLYLTRHQQPARIMLAVAQQLREAGARRGLDADLFSRYLDALEGFYASRGESTDDQRRALEQAFLDDYQAAANSCRRVVVLIDTLEKLHPTIADAEPFDFRRVGRLESWLADLVARLPNSVVVLAGRPRARQRQLFAGRLGSRLRVVPVAPFTLDETAAYVAGEFPELRDALPVDVLHSISAGRPVVLAIALACAQLGVFDLGALPPGFEQQYPDNQLQLSDAFVRLLVGDLQLRRPGLAQLLAKAVYLRKGLRLPLLAQIARDEGEPFDQDEVARQLDTIGGFVLVKRVDEQEVILHDEIYELLLGKIGDQEAVGWWRSAMHFLDDEIADTLARLRALPQRGDPAARAGAATLQQRLQTLQVERTFYQMSADLRRGYQSYRELSANTIAARDDDFDTLLQEELARFFDGETEWGRLFRRRLVTSGLTWDQIIYDEGIRWVYRRIGAHIPGTDRYLAAIEIAERVRARYPEICAASTLARCDLDAAQLQAEVYTPELAPRGAQIGANFERLVADLEAVIAATPADDPDSVYSKFILANAYNYWGYFERTQERLHSATEKYSRAIAYYRQLGPEVENLHATTLNNLGYALTRQGESEQGLHCVDASLAMVERIGSSYRIATTLNTRAHLLADLNQAEQALRSTQVAQGIFEGLESVRGQALCANAEGRIRSKIADALPPGPEQDAEYGRATAAYALAIDIFDTKIEGEISRRIETRVSLSKCFRDWAAVKADGGAHEQARALELLAEARALMTPQTPRLVRCTILESMAVVFVDRGEFAHARELLAEAVTLLPENLQDQERLAESAETQELRLNWLRFAQIELQLMLCAFGEGRRAAACAHMVRAFTGLITFSPDAAPLGRFRALARRTLRAVADSAELARLRGVAREAGARMDAPAAALNTVDRLFAQTIQDIDLFGPEPGRPV
jgi:tetratricopeptide (TPR) repeat protein